MFTVDDPNRLLQPSERKELKRFILEDCYTTTTDVAWLKQIFIFSSETERLQFRGICISEFKDAGTKDTCFESIIALNTLYNLKVIKGKSKPDMQMLKATLAHEYGHNWTLGYLLTKGMVTNPKTERAERLYYKIRRLKHEDYKAWDGGTSSLSEWLRSDKEVLAEDYRCLLTPFKDMHDMRDTAGKPSAEVAEYLRGIGRPSWRCRLHHKGFSRPSTS